MLLHIWVQTGATLRPTNDQWIITTLYSKKKKRKILFAIICWTFHCQREMFASTNTRCVCLKFMPCLRMWTAVNAERSKSQITLLLSKSTSVALFTLHTLLPRSQTVLHSSLWNWAQQLTREEFLTGLNSKLKSASLACPWRLWKARINFAGRSYVSF